MKEYSSIFIHQIPVLPYLLLWQVKVLVSQLCLPGSSVHGILQAKNIGVGCYFLLQGIFSTQGSNPGFLHCRQTVYCLSYQGSSGKLPTFPLTNCPKYTWNEGFPGGSDGKESACSAGDPGSTPGSGRTPQERNGCPLQYSCLENPMDRGAQRATVHRVAKSQTWLKQLSMYVGTTIYQYSLS